MSVLRIVQNIIGSMILIWFGWYLWQNRSLFDSVKDVSFTNAWVLTLLVLLSWLSASSQSYILYRQSGARVGYTECYFLTMASTFGNYLPMRAGTVVRAHYMKRIHSLDYIQFASIFSIRLILTFIAAGICGLTATLIMIGVGSHSLVMLMLFGGMITIPALFYVWRPSNKLRKNIFFYKWKKFSDGIQTLKSSPSTSLTCLILIVIQLVLLGWRFQIAAQILGNESELAVFMVLVALATVAGFTSVTPGGLGIRETLMGYATLAIGTGFSLGVLIGSIDRAILLVLTSVLGGISFLWVWIRVARSNFTPKQS